MEKEQEPSARPVTLCATSNDGDGDGNGDIMNLCFGSTRIMRIILGFLRFNVYAIFLLRMVSKKFNNWVRPFVFSHLTINRKRFQEYASCHPFPFIPCRILLNDNFDDISPMVTHMTIGKQLSFTKNRDEHQPLREGIKSSRITHLRFEGGLPDVDVSDNVISLSFLFEQAEFYYCKTCEQLMDHLPPSIDNIAFPGAFNLSVDQLPSSLTHLMFGFKFNQPVDNLPNSIRYLQFGREFNQSIDRLPSTLTHLILGSRFNQPVDSLPNSIVKLKFGFEFNKPVDNLPHSIKKIIFGSQFNQTVDHLPSSTAHIKFGDRFNQCVANLPLSVTRLCFKSDFNQPVNNLPPHLITLEFEGKFNQPVDLLPSSLKYLEFNCWFNQPIDKLRSSLIYLSLGESYTQSHIPQVASLRIKHLERYKLPNTITHLSFGGDFNEPIKELPTSITHLETSESFNQPIDRLPDSITHLAFGHDFNQEIGCFPKSLLVLQFGSSFNQPLQNLPIKLTHLIIGIYESRFNYPLNNLPESLLFLFMPSRKWYPHPLELRPQVLFFQKKSRQFTQYFDFIFRRYYLNKLLLDYIYYALCQTSIGYLKSFIESGAVESNEE